MRIPVPRRDDTYGSYSTDKPMDTSENLNSPHNKEFSVPLTDTEQDEDYLASPASDTEVLESISIPHDGSADTVFGASSTGGRQRVRSCAFPSSSSPKHGRFGSVFNPVSSSEANKRSSDIVFTN